jgi:hypothetical protein
MFRIKTADEQYKQGFFEELDAIQRSDEKTSETKGGRSAQTVRRGERESFNEGEVF